MHRLLCACLAVFALPSCLLTTHDAEVRDPSQIEFREKSGVVLSPGAPSASIPNPAPPRPGQLTREADGSVRYRCWDCTTTHTLVSGDGKLPQHLGDVRFVNGELVTTYMLFPYAKNRTSNVVDLRTPQANVIRVRVREPRNTLFGGLMLGTGVLGLALGAVVLSTPKREDGTGPTNGQRTAIVGTLGALGLSFTIGGVVLLVRGNAAREIYPPPAARAR